MFQRELEITLRNEQAAPARDCDSSSQVAPRFECSICFEEVEGGYSRKKGKRSGGGELKQRACFRPCNHAGACTECAVDIWNKTNKCPFCETKLSGKPAAIHFWPGTLADTPYDLILEWILCIKSKPISECTKVLWWIFLVLEMAFFVGVSLTRLSVTSLNIISLHGFVQRSLLQIGNSLQIPINVGIHINQESELNLIPIELNWIVLNSRCMHCHSIFPFDWNLIFTKSIQFFHQLIGWSSFVVCSSVELY